MSAIRTAVVGAGYFGRFHAKHYEANPKADLVAVVDIDKDRAGEVAQEVGAEPLHDHMALVGRVEAASVAASTERHFDIARDLLQAGIHLLVEKPLTDNYETACELAELAKAKGCLLQVGHIERFSAPFRALSELITQPLFIECYRIAPWKERGLDTDVVLDLMAHDINLVQGLVDASVESVHAVGAPILTANEDMANVRMVFDNGCVVNATASRISFKTQRNMRIFQPNSYVVCDFDASRIVHAHRKEDPALRGPQAIDLKTTEIPKEDNLANEIAAFLDCVESGRKPVVDGFAGCETLRVANMVNDSMREHRKRIEAQLAGA
jgi:predicted dehydrogenase